MHTDVVNVGEQPGVGLRQKAFPYFLKLFSNFLKHDDTQGT
jgi:hypothetical protein